MLYILLCLVFYNTSNSDSAVQITRGIRLQNIEMIDNLIVCEAQIPEETNILLAYMWDRDSDILSSPILTLFTDNDLSKLWRYSILKDPKGEKYVVHLLFEVFSNDDKDSSRESKIHLLGVTPELQLVYHKVLNKSPDTIPPNFSNQKLGLYSITCVINGELNSYRMLYREEDDIFLFFNMRTGEILQLHIPQFSEIYRLIRIPEYSDSSRFPLMAYKKSHLELEPSAIPRHFFWLNIDKSGMSIEKESDIKGLSSHIPLVYRDSDDLLITNRGGNFYQHRLGDSLTSKNLISKWGLFNRAFSTYVIVEDNLLSFYQYSSTTKGYYKIMTRKPPFENFILISFVDDNVVLEDQKYSIWLYNTKDDSFNTLRFPETIHPIGYRDFLSRITKE